MILDEQGRVIAPPQTSPAPDPKVRLVCSYCRAVIREALSPAPLVSHGVCATCLPIAHKEIDDYFARRP